MTAASLEKLRGELARLRSRAVVQIAQELREARSFGEGSNNDEYHAVREEQMVLEVSWLRSSGRSNAPPSSIPMKPRGARPS
jgi:transcription elongation GreA/GreB family factor